MHLLKTLRKLFFFCPKHDEPPDEKWIHIFVPKQRKQLVLHMLCLYCLNKKLGIYLPQEWATPDLESVLDAVQHTLKTPETGILS